MKTALITPMLALLTSASIYGATVAGSSLEWTALPGNFDFVDDQSSGKISLNIVGTATNPGLFVAHNADGTFGFRLRLGGPGKEDKYQKAAYLGIDADFNDTIDIFVGVDFSGSNTSVGLFAAGSSANTNPGNTSVGALLDPGKYTADSPDYNYRAVETVLDGATDLDLDASTRVANDYYLSVMVDFADIVSHLSDNGILITADSGLRYVAATSTSPNSLNHDVAGVDSNTSGVTTWTGSGGITSVLNTDGTEFITVPEPSVPAFSAIILLGLLLRRKR